MGTLFRLGTRGSPLALTQARMTVAALCAAHGWDADDIEIVTVKTTGDRVQDRPLAELGGKAVWTKELEGALLEGRIDAAVHSMKDVETWRPEGLALAAMLPRADVRDRLVGAADLFALPQGGRLGTSSPRRAAQALALRPDLEIVQFRGNVDTRLAKLAAGEAEATMLAAAGLDRLGRGDVGTAVATDVMLPAPAQGAVGIEIRQNDAKTREIVAKIDDAPTSRAVHTERALLDGLHGTCRSPVAALALLDGDGALHLRGEILLPDGSERHAGERRVPAADGIAAAHDLAAELLGKASAELRALFGG